MTHGAVRGKTPPRPEGRRISSSAVGAEPLGKFFNLPDSIIAIQKFVLTRPDRFGVLLGHKTISFQQCTLSAGNDLPFAEVAWSGHAVTPRLFREA